MSTGPKMYLAAAEALAEALVDELAPACDRIEVAGSIRRRADVVGDIEIVAIPRYEERLTGQRALFGPDPTEPVNVLWEAISEVGPDRLLPIKPGADAAVADANWPDKRLAGSKYFRVWLPLRGCKLDLFLATPETWGCLLAIRTGSERFSKALLSRWIGVSHGGHCQGARLHRPNGQVLSTPEEKDVFEACRVEWVPAHLRRSAADLRPVRDAPADQRFRVLEDE